MCIRVVISWPIGKNLKPANLSITELFPALSQPTTISRGNWIGNSPIKFSWIEASWHRAIKDPYRNYKLWIKGFWPLLCGTLEDNIFLLVPNWFPLKISCLWIRRQEIIDFFPYKKSTWNFRDWNFQGSKYSVKTCLIPIKSLKNKKRLIVESFPPTLSIFNH